MRKLILRLLKKIIFLCNFIISKYFQTEKQIVLHQWLNANRDKFLRLEYDLDEDSLVFDIGGYEGQWASDIFSKYSCRIYVFEPIPEYANNIEKRFSRNEKIRIFKFGLGNSTKNAKISLNNDRSSFLKGGKEYRNSQIVRAVNFIKEHDINEIDLMKINIEGGEYDLLEDLINSGEITKINNIQIQFHDFIANAETRMIKIQKMLRKTHYLTYQYKFIWENWSIKQQYN